MVDETSFIVSRGRYIIHLSEFSASSGYRRLCLALALALALHQKKRGITPIMEGKLIPGKASAGEQTPPIFR